MATKDRRLLKAAKDRGNPLEPRLGIPERPKGLPRAQRRAWNALTAQLLAERKLSVTDGPRLLELLQARAGQYKAAGECREAARQRVAEIEAIFEQRTPFPEPEAPPPEVPPAVTLEAFLGAVRNERATFSQRMRAGETVCWLSQNERYDWPAGDAATIARDYCINVMQGSIVACDLLKRACRRTLDDLEHGADRGLFFDPLAARNIVTWFQHFCGLSPQPWEAWILTSLFAWKQPSGLRRFREAWISMGKKNGKSALAAAVGLFGLVADGEKFAEVYSAAVKKDQARIVWKDACRYVAANSELGNYIRKFVGSLSDETTDSVFQPLSSDTRSLDGLRPSFVLADEIHEWPDRENWDKVSFGTASRTQPLIVAITTAGVSQENFAYSKFQIAERILNGIIVDDRIFVAIYQFDSEQEYKDETAWVKSNPNLGVSIHLESIQKQLADVEHDPSALNNFLRYQGNRWITFRVGRSLPAGKWDACIGPPEIQGKNPLEMREWFLREYRGVSCWGGIDYGAKDDLTAFVLLFRCGDNRAVVPWFWMPEEGLLQKESAWGVPLSAWAREGWISLVSGDIVDPEAVRHDVARICGQHTGSLRELGYDPWHLDVWAKKLAEDVGQVNVIATPQSPANLTQACQDFRVAVFQGKLWHLNNPVLRWMAGNVVLEEDKKHNGIRPDKLSPREKIDGIQATITAWARFIGENPDATLKVGSYGVLCTDENTGVVTFHGVGDYEPMSTKRNSVQEDKGETPAMTDLEQLADDKKYAPLQRRLLQLWIQNGVAQPQGKVEIVRNGRKSLMDVTPAAALVVRGLAKLAVE